MYSAIKKNKYNGYHCWSCERMFVGMYQRGATAHYESIDDYIM
jgi:hypothetical protein